MTENNPTTKNTLANTTITAGGNVHVGDHITYLMAGKPVAIPRYLSLHVPLSADDIIGRERELDETYRLLHSGKPTVLVNGVGGMGKTATAVKYIARYGHTYAHLAWLTVSGTLLDAFIGNAPLLQAFKDQGLETDVQSYLAMKNPEAAFQLVLKALNDLGDKAKTLVVLDNANQLPDLVAHKKHFDTAHCHFLLTSRTRPAAWQIVAIERLPDAEALALFRRHYPTANPEDAPLLRLLARLDFHTLLIELVAKSAARSGIAFEHLQAIVHDKFIHDPALNKRPVETGGHGDSLEDQAKRAKVEEYIWLIFENITQLHDGEKALLRAFALLPTATAFDEAFLAPFAKLFDLEAHLFDRLERLGERGWLDKVQESGQPPAYKIHPLIAEVAVKHLAVDAGYAEPYISYVANLINYDSLDPKHNLFEKRTQQYLAERLKDLFFEASHEKVSHLLDRLMTLEAELGIYEKAASYGDRALAIAEKNFGADHSNVAALQSSLGNVYGALGYYDRAAVLLETALASDIKNFGHQNPSVAVHQSNLAIVYRKLGKYDLAEVLLEAALDSDLKIFGPDHPNVAVHQSNLANVYRALGRYDHAASILESALAIIEKNFGLNHPNVALCQSNLSAVYGDMGLYDRAAELLEVALHNYSKNFDLDHPNIAIFQSNLATIYNDLGRYDRATELLETALASAEKNFGPDHPIVAVYQSNLGGVYRNLGRYERAAQLFQTALASDLKNFDPYHPTVARSQSNLGEVYQNLGRYERANELLQTALNSDLKNFGPDHPTVARSQSNLAVVYLKTGEKAKAKNLFQAALQNLLKNFGPEHPHTKTVQTWLS